jgi:DNA-binding GntR family transcriptional regulator
VRDGADGPWMPAELESIYRLREQIEVELATRACLCFQPGQLDWLYRRLELFSSTRVSPSRSLALHRSFMTGLLSPAMTAVDHRILTPMWHEVDQHLDRYLIKNDGHPGEQPDCLEQNGKLIDSFRLGDPALVRQAMLDNIERKARIMRTLPRRAG